jgi:Rha family phage regulatory protein
MTYNPMIQVREGRYNGSPVINTKDLSIFCCRSNRHDNFIAAARKVISEDPAFAAGNIFFAEYRTKKNQTHPCFDLTKQGTKATLHHMHRVSQYLPRLMAAFDAVEDGVGMEVEGRADVVIPSISCSGTIEADPEPELAPIDSPIVRMRDGNTYTTSLDVAAFCRKRHADVLRAIENLNSSEEFRQRNFALAYVPDAQGKERPAYDITRSGAVFLISGFTGAEAGRFKEAYINEFDRMEEALKSRVTLHPNLPMTYEASLEQLLIEVRKNSALVIANTELKEKVEEQYDSLQKYRDMLDHHGLVLPSDLARSWRINPNVFFDRLFMAGLIFRPRPGKPWVAYSHSVNRGWMVNRLTPYTDPNGVEKSSNQTYLTPRGIEKVEPLFKDTSGQGRLMLVK